MTDSHENSLGDENTFNSGSEQPAANSLGDEATMGGAFGADHATLDDGTAVVEIEARYTIEGVLGKGGMGEVLLATDKTLGRRVAIKRMIGDSVKSRTAISRFLSEARAIARLDHLNIVDVYDSARCVDGPFMVMQYIDGGTLLDRCRDGRIAIDEAIDLTCQLCDALTVCHEAGVIHRDIKPANILMTKDGSPRLTDFGLVKDESEDYGQTVAGAVLGTLDFMPPEQRKDAKLVDSRSDLWSLAATLYQLVTGKSPRVIKLNAVPASLQRVLEKALEDSKEARYQTASEFRAALKQVAKQSGEVSNQASLDLGVGECPKCHSRNEASRKFCRECACVLQVACLRCEQDMPVWDKVCGECGAQQDLLAKQNAAFEMAGDFFSDGEAEKAFQELNGLDMSGIDEERENLWRTIQIYTDAHRAFKERRFRDCLRSLENISLVDTNDTCRRLEERAENSLDRLDHLLEEIDSHSREDNPKVLLPLVEEAITLSHDSGKLESERSRLIALDAKNQQIRAEAFDNAKHLFKEKNYKACIGELQRIDPSVVDHEIRSLIGSAEANRDRLEELLAEIEDSRFGVDPVKVLRLTLEAIDLSHDPKFLEKKRVELEQRIEADRTTFDECLVIARGAFDKKQYKLVADSLSRISPFLETSEVLDLRSRAVECGDRLKALLSEIDCDRITQEPPRLIELIEDAINLSADPGGLRQQKSKLEARDRESRTLKIEYLTTAKRLCEKNDFESCLQELDKIEPYLRDDSCEDLKKTASDGLNRLSDLLLKIKNLEGEDPSFLLPVLDEAIALSRKPYELELQRDRVRKAIEQNQRVLDESFKKAQDFLAHNEFDKAIKEIDLISPYVVTEECVELSKKATAARDRRKSLRQAIKDKVSKKDVIDLVPLIDEAISLEKSRDEIEKLEKLKSNAAIRHGRLEGQGELLIAEAKAALLKGDYDSALSLIEEVPTGFENDTCEEIASKSRELSALRDKATDSLEKQLRKAMPKLETKQSAAYLLGVEKVSVRDGKFKSYLILHKQKSEKKRQEHKYKVKWRIATLVAFLFVAGGIYGAKLYTDRQEIKLANAIDERRWEDALFLDENSEQALFGMTEELLTRQPLDSEAINTYLNRLDAISSSRSSLNDLKRQSHISLALEAATKRNIELAEAELEKAVKLGAQKDEFTHVYVDLAIAHQRRAITLLKEDNWSFARQECEKAVEYGSDSSSIGLLLAETYEQEGDQHLRSKFADKAITAFRKAEQLDSGMKLRAKISEAEQILAERDISEKGERTAELEANSSISLTASQDMPNSDDDQPVTSIAKAESDASQSISNYAESPTAATRDAALAAIAKLKKLAPSSPSIPSLETKLDAIDSRINTARLQAVAAVTALGKELDGEGLDEACAAIETLFDISPSHPSIRPLLQECSKAFTSINQKLLAGLNHSAVWNNHQKMQVLCRNLCGGDNTLFSHQFYWFEKSKLFFANAGDTQSHLVADFGDVKEASGFSLAVDAVRHQIVIGCTMPAASIRLWRIDISKFELSSIYTGQELGAILEDLFVIPNTGDIIVAPHSLSVKPGGKPGGMQLVSYDGSTVSTLKPRTWYRHDFDYSPQTDTIYYTAFPTYNGKSPSGFSGIRSMLSSGEEDSPVSAFPLQVQVALDSEQDVIYFTKVSSGENAGNAIHRMSLNTKEMDVAFEEETVAGIHHVDFDPVTQKLIWTAISKDGKDTIQSSATDGSSKQILFEQSNKAGKLSFRSFAARTIVKVD